jgi:aspartyl-tRNA(Asn)/glutamyl-tRNA(Gln) amidotransferase subunit C
MSSDPPAPPAPAAAISRDEVAHLARLARIELGSDELDHLAGQLEGILAASPG